MNFTRIGLVAWDNLGLLRIARSSLTQILVEIQGLVVASGAYTLPQVSISLEQKPKPTKTGPFVLIRPGRHNLIPSQWDGAGSYLAGYKGWIPITIYDQCMLDSAGGGDDFALLRTDQGLYDRAITLSEYLTGEAASRTLTQTGLVQTPLSVHDMSDANYIDHKEKRWRSVTLTMSLDWSHVYQQGGA